MRCPEDKPLFMGTNYLISTSFKPTTTLGLWCPWGKPYANDHHFEGGSPQGDANGPPPKAFYSTV